MANLRYSDKHNMVAFLKKPTEIDGFTEIVDFLKGSSLRYALTHNPTIYDSLVKQFWQTATVRTLANRIQELVAFIDNKEYTIIEASVKSKLQLTDAACISNLPDAEIYEGLTTLGFLQIILDITTKNNGKYLAKTLTKKLFANKKRGYAGDHIPLLPAMLASAAPDQDEATTISVGVDTEGATTTTYGLDAELENGNIHESQLRSHETPLYEGHTSGSVKDSLKLQELMVLVPKLESKVDSLEKELKETKQTLGNAILTLVKKVKSLEVALKRKTKRVIVSDSKDEETNNQGRKIQDIDDDPLVSLVRDFVTPTKTKVSASGETQEDISPTILEAAKTLLKVASHKARLTHKGRRYKRRKMSMGKDINTRLDAEIEDNTSKVGVNTGSIEINTGREEINTEAMRLQALQDEETARQVHLDALLAKRIQEEQELSEQQLKRKAKVQKATQYYIEEDWDIIKAKLEANAKLTKSLQGESMTGEDFAKRMVEMINQKKKFYAEQKAKAKRSKPMTQAQQRDYMSTFIKNQSSWKLTQLKKLTFVELKTEFEKLLEQGISKKQKIVVEDVPEEKGNEPIKKIGKRRKQIARKGIHTNKTEKDEAKKDMEASEKCNPSLGTNIPVNPVPVVIKPPNIENFKIIKLGKKDDLTKLYRLVMERYGTNGPEDEYERVFWGDLKTMFDPPLSTDPVWSLPDKKLQGDKRDEACYQLLKLIEKQAQNKLP
ncbi:hypothetical protein Tco_0976173 [Tanacetum coccineum]|uniref:Xylulose kinase-1 n=1 Tax=Tanacetum coccineum TaxID=301880 RepID=A0ABQ5EGL7_9ASTR